MADVIQLDKCKCLHPGHEIIRVNYQMRGTILCKSVKEKDLLGP